jgi:hypothetical protein
MSTCLVVKHVIQKQVGVSLRQKTKLACRRAISDAARALRRTKREENFTGEVERPAALPRVVPATIFRAPARGFARVSAAGWLFHSWCGGLFGPASRSGARSVKQFIGQCGRLRKISLRHAVIGTGSLHSTAVRWLKRDAMMKKRRGRYFLTPPLVVAGFFSILLITSSCPTSSFQNPNSSPNCHRVSWPSTSKSHQKIQIRPQK